MNFKKHEAGRPDNQPRSEPPAGRAGPALGLAGCLVSLTLVLETGCESGLHRIDRQVDTMVSQASQHLGPDALAPSATGPSAPLPPHVERRSSAAAEQPSTVNPSAADLPYAAAQDAANVLERLNSYNEPAADAIKIDLPTALAFSTEHAREYKFAEEEYVITALRLLVERHQWGPRFFDEVSALAVGSGDSGLYDTSLRLVNELRVTQRLPYGGEISARALATAAEDLHRRVSGENVQNAAVILQADLPLLRGSGLTAREGRIQAERSLIYAARDFEQFRRDFFFDVAQDFLNLVVQQRAIMNAEKQVQRLQEAEDRERGLYVAGRTPLFQAALAEQSKVSALDTLNARREIYRLAVDRFKVRLGVAADQPVEIAPSGFDLPPPQIDMDEAVRQAMAYRLDLQTQRDRVDDALRRVDVARNAVLPDLNLVGVMTIPTDPEKQRAGLDFAPGDANFSAGVTFGVPLDRQIELAGVRQAQISLERERRAFDQDRDNATISVRSTVRDIDRARYTLAIQERSVAIGEQRQASLDAAPDRATARDRSDAANENLRARDRRDTAARDVQVAILRYLLETGQLRVDRQGHLLPLRGMPLNADADAIGPAEPAPNQQPAEQPPPQPVPVPPDAG